MPDEPPQKPKSCCCGFLRFHASTVAITSLLLLPILLLVLPGREKGGGGTTGFWTTHFQHGLPFAFLERQTVEYSGTWANNKFTPGAKPKDVDFKAMALKCLNNESFNSTQEDWGFTGLRMNLPEQELGSFGEFESESIYEDRFWSDPNRWPWIGDADGEAMRVCWLGLLANVLLFLLFFCLVSRLLEYRLSKRHSHFAFSVAELLAAVCVAGVLLAWGSAEYRRAVKEDIAADALIAAFKNPDGYLDLERSSGLPVVVSELVDNRCCLPMLDTPLFHPIKQADIGIFYDESPQTPVKPFIDALQNVKFPVKIRISVDEGNLQTLKQLTDMPAIKNIQIVFDLPAETDIDFKLMFPCVEEIAIELQSDIGNENQLKIITPSFPHLKRLEIYFPDHKGIAFLNSIAKDLPTETWVVLAAGDEGIELSAPMKTKSSK